MKRKLIAIPIIWALLNTSISSITVYAYEVNTDFPISEELPQQTNEDSSIEETPNIESSSSSFSMETETTESSVSPEIPESSNEPIQSEQEQPKSDNIGVSAECQRIFYEQSEPVQSDQKTTIVKNEVTEIFIRQIGEKARAIGQKNDLYASVMIAQAILETGAGGSLLSQEPYHNLFGIKGNYEGQSIIFSTQEDDGFGHCYTIDAAFKQYPSYKESFEDYAELMKEGIESNQTIYSGIWKSNTVTYQDATNFLTGVYATDINYGQKLNALIEEYDLYKYDIAESTKTLSNLITTSTNLDSDFPDYSGQIFPGSEAYAVGNCTQYVYNRIVQLGGYVETHMGNGMDWSNTGRLNDYRVTCEPKAGAAVSFQPNVAGADGTYGHVAFVEHVYEDGSILISEMNVAGLGVVSFRIIDQNTAVTLNYITPK